MSQRITNVCQRRFPPASLDVESVGSLLASFTTPNPQSTALLAEIAKESNLEIVDLDCLMEFTKEKLISYLENLQSSLRKL